MSDTDAPPLRPESSSVIAARQQADLGLPLGPTRFRLFKQAVTRVSWVFLNHQVAFNNHVLDALTEVVDDLYRRSRELEADLRRVVDESIERGLRRVYREIGDHVARSESQFAHLSQELASIRADLARLGEGATPATPGDPGG